MVFSQTSTRINVVLRPLPVVVLGAALLVGASGCTKRVVPLDQIVFGANPSKDMTENVESFKQLPKEDAEILLSYIVANDIQKMKGQQSVSMEGKTVPQALEEARQWSVVIKQYMQQSEEITQQMRAIVNVVPVSKRLTEAPTELGTNAQVVTIRYKVINQSADQIAGVKGQMRYWWKDGREIGVFDVNFSGPFQPGESGVLDTARPILVGSNATDIFRKFAAAELGELKYDFRPTVLVYQDGRIVKIPTF